MKIIDDNDKLITIANETKLFFLPFIIRMQPVVSLGTSGRVPKLGPYFLRIAKF